MKPGDYRQAALKWDGNTLRLGRRALATIEPDAKWPGMWRVRINGRITDMVNLTRAKDAAITLALADLNRPVSHRDARQARLNGHPYTDAPKG